MQILIEQLTPKEEKDSSDVAYYTFWVRFTRPGMAQTISMAGWRYWPANRTISTPSVAKGKGSYFNMCKVSRSLYLEVLMKVEAALEITAPMPPLEASQNVSDELYAL